MIRVVRVAGALAIMLIILAGVPALLLMIGRLDALMPLTIPRLTGRDDGSLLLGLITLIAWLSWLVVASAIIAELIALFTSERVRVTIPGTGWLRPATAGLVMSLGALASITTLSASTGAAAPQPTTTVGPSATRSGTEQTDSSNEPQAGSEFSRHTVKEGDDLWSLAEKYLDSGVRWRLIAEANPWLDPAAQLESGAVLRIPAQLDPATPSSEPAPQQPQPEQTPIDQAEDQPAEVTVRKGDTLWGIADRELGDPLRWREIHQLNQDQVSDPDQIDIGWQLKMPTNPYLTARESLAAPEPDNRPASDQAQVPGSDPDTQGAPDQSKTRADGDAGQDAAASATPPDQIGSDPDEDQGAVVPPAQPQNGPTSDKAPENPVSKGISGESGERDSQTSKDTLDGGEVPVAPTGAIVQQGQVEDLSSAVVPLVGQSQPDGSAGGETTPTTEQQRSAQITAAEYGWVAGIGSGLALGLLMAVKQQRIRQFWQRPLGRRLPALSESERRLASALEKQVAPDQPEVNPSSTTVVLGWDNATTVTVCLEQVGTLSLIGEPSRTMAMLAAISSSLLCSEWSAEVNQTLVGNHECWGAELDDPSVGELAIDEGLDILRELVGSRQSALGQGELDVFRSDPDLAALWEPRVFLFCSELSPAERLEVVQLCQANVGVSAVILGAGGVPCLVDDDGTAQFDDHRFEAQLVSAPARRALIQLFRTASSNETTPAPWWPDEDLSPNVTPLRPVLAREEFSMNPTPSNGRYPKLLLLGPVELTGATGDVPTRAVKQCIEYCAWLLANPGRTGSVMAAELMVAEPTRRSNLSRLRTWLGKDPEGASYLPEAYSGRIQLHPDVTSDWEEFSLIISGGVNRVGMAALRRALALVRGAPMADAAPWQWQWADELRSDMISTIRDAAVVLVEQALELGDPDLASWALARGQAAAGDDESLLAWSAVIAHRNGKSAEAQRIAMNLFRQAKMSGVDVQLKTVRLLQQVIEGRERVRQL